MRLVLPDLEINIYIVNIQQQTGQKHTRQCTVQCLDMQENVNMNPDICLILSGYQTCSLL